MMMVVMTTLVMMMVTALMMMMVTTLMTMMVTTLMMVVVVLIVVAVMVLRTMTCQKRTRTLKLYSDTDTKYTEHVTSFIHSSQ